MKTITTGEIAKQLPMRVVSMKNGMTYGKIVRFFEVRQGAGKDWQLKGNTLDGKIIVLELQKDTLYRLLV
jgi:hypothetical protein